MRNNAKKEKLYAVIGLGRFGFSLAKRLAEAGKDLIVIDRKETVINDAVTFTDNAYMMTDLSKENLRNVGIQNCDTVIVGIGSDFAVSVLTTMIVLQLGVPHVIAKALTEEQGCVLDKLGAEVVYPEREMGVRLANRLLAPRVMEYIALNDDISITEILIPDTMPEMTVQEYLDFAAELKGIKKKADRKEQVRKAARRTGLEEVTFWQSWYGTIR